MAKGPASSIGEAMSMAVHQVEIDARNQSYAVATEISKVIAGKFGSTDAVSVAKYWAETSDLVFRKIVADQKAILELK